MNPAKALKEAEVERCIATERLDRFQKHDTRLAAVLDPVLLPLGYEREPGSIRFTDGLEASYAARRAS